MLSPSLLILLAQLAQAPQPVDAPDAGGLPGEDAGVAPALVAVPAPPPLSRRDGGLGGPGEDDELDEMRAMEEATIDPAARADAALRTSLARLGYGTSLKDRLEDALDRADQSGDELPFVLAPITDVENFDVTLVRDRYDIPIEMQPLVVQYIHFFQGGGRKWFRHWMGRSSRFIPLFQPILEEKGLPRDLVYLSMIESGFNTQATSWAKAVGPWQFIPGTAKLFKLKDDFWVDERRDPIKSTRAAADYLALLHQTLGHWYLAWAGYNTGGGRMRWMVEKYGSTDFWELSTKKGLAKETQHYVPKLIACALVAKHPEAFGFTADEFEYEGPFEYDEVPLTDPVDLEVLATSAGTTVEALQELNPEIKRWCTPPATEKEPYLLRIPKGARERFAEAFAKYAPSEHLHFKVHRVVKGDTLSKIAARYHSAQEAIMRLNGLQSVRGLRLNSELMVPVPSAGALQAGKMDAALERQVVQARRSGLAAMRPDEEIPAGSQPERAPKAGAVVGGTFRVDKVAGKSKVTYGVARGDSLWSIARRFDVRVADLREWNEGLGSMRGLKVGLPLVVWAGAAADLSQGTTAPKAIAPKEAPAKVTTAKVAKVKGLVRAPRPRQATHH